MKKEPNPLVVITTVPVGLYCAYLIFFRGHAVASEQIANICLVIGVIAALFCIFWVARALIGATLEIIGIIVFIAKGGRK